MAPKFRYICNLGWALWIRNSFEFKFDDTGLSSYYWDSQQGRYFAMQLKWTNLIFILWGKTGIIKFEFKNTLGFIVSDLNVQTKIHEVNKKQFYNIKSSLVFTFKVYLKFKFQWHTFLFFRPLWIVIFLMLTIRL